MSPDPRAALPNDTIRFALGSVDLCRWYFPSRGLAGSLILHTAALTVLALLFPRFHVPIEGIPLEPLSRSDPGGGTMVVYLPSVGGGHRGGGKGGGSGSDSPRQGPPRPTAPAGGKGLVYPGPQLIHSDSPNPTNRIQTLLQPELKDPPILSPPLNLPNFISSPNIVPARPKPVETVMTLPVPSPPPEPPMAVPDPRKGEAAAAKTRAATQTAIGLADTDKPETQLPLIPVDGAALKRVRQRLEDLPVIREGVDKPALVSKDEVAVARPVKEAIAVDAPIIDVKPLEKPAIAIDQPKAPVDPTLAPRAAKAVETGELVAATEPIVAPVTPPPTETDASYGRTILALTPMPATGAPPAEIPLGEARGRFAMSPDPNLDTAETEPGSPSAVAGKAADGAVGERAFDPNLPSSVTISFGPGGGGGSGSGTGSGAGPGSGSGSGPGSGAGTGSGAGSGSGPGIGSGSGSGTGSGSGAGSGPGSGPFADISIVGGVGGPTSSGSGTGSGSGNAPLSGITIGGGGGSAAPSKTVADGDKTGPRAGRYELFVLSTEKGGGGLPYIGVFANDQVQTVYLDMRKPEAEEADLWTFEFAVPRESSGQVVSLDSQQGFLLPVPIVREAPSFPGAVVTRHAGKMVIVYAVVNTQGRMEQLEIKESPDPLLNQPVLEALRKWTFRAGVFNGRPASVRTLLGIPLSNHEPVSSSGLSPR